MIDGDLRGIMMISDDLRGIMIFVILMMTIFTTKGALQVTMMQIIVRMNIVILVDLLHIFLNKSTKTLHIFMNFPEFNCFWLIYKKSQATEEPQIPIGGIDHKAIGKLVPFTFISPWDIGAYSFCQSIRIGLAYIKAGSPYRPHIILSWLIKLLRIGPNNPPSTVEDTSKV